MHLFSYRNMEIGHSLGNESGVTILETMVYMVLSGMLLGAAVMAFQGQNKSYNRQDEIAEIQANIRGASSMMVSEIRFAGYDPANKGAGFLTAEANELSFDYWKDTDDDGFFKDETTPQTITYDLYDAYDDGTQDIGRKEGGQKRAIAENIEQLRFEYMFWNTNLPGGEDWDWANSATEIADDLGGIPVDKAREVIKAVKIIILGSARSSAYSITDPTIYRPPLAGGSTATWTPAAGSGHKRMMSVIVQCRNIL